MYKPVISPQEQDLINNTPGSFSGFFRGMYYLTWARFFDRPKYDKAWQYAGYIWNEKC